MHFLKPAFALIIHQLMLVDSLNNEYAADFLKCISLFFLFIDLVTHRSKNESN